MIYELYCERPSGEIIYCGDFTSQIDADAAIFSLSNEYPDNEYWWEVIYEDEQR
ncbi:hypothetical protein PMW_71 [Pseudomonas phage phiPMW]|uniref:Uncharacterized protein n=1 Tax=Pseudomonas phage phiPMW TaxID=1815582 RepID=A0A1S5R1B0_9CAUD|nr:hypothetical protein FDG97_gp071 [Pseudomonas phage phiPMW]ANA49196.1 hypothetical protein PMW_71 [Pseudomonas phage phiPMW]